MAISTERVVDSLMGAMDVSASRRSASEDYLKYVSNQPGGGECLLSIVMDSNVNNEARQMAAVVVKMLAINVPISVLAKAILQCDCPVISRQLAAGISPDKVPEAFGTLLSFSESADISDRLQCQKIITALATVTGNADSCSSLPFISDAALTRFIDGVITGHQAIEDLPTLVVNLTLPNGGNTTTVEPWMKSLCDSGVSSYLTAAAGMVAKNTVLGKGCEQHLEVLLRDGADLQASFNLLSKLKRIGADFSTETLKRLINGYLIPACKPTEADLLAVREQPTEYVRQQSRTVRSLASSILSNILTSCAESSAIVGHLMTSIPLETISSDNCDSICQVLSIFTPVIRALGADHLGPKRQLFFESVLLVVGAKSDVLKQQLFFPNAVVDSVVLVAAFAKQIPPDHHSGLLLSLVKLLGCCDGVPSATALRHATCAAIDKIGQLCVAGRTRSQDFPAIVTEAFPLLVKPDRFEEERCCESLARFFMRFAKNAESASVHLSMSTILGFLSAADFSKVHPASLFYLFDSVLILCKELSQRTGIQHLSYYEILFDIVKRNTNCEPYVYQVAAGLLRSGLLGEGIIEIAKLALVSTDESKFDLFEALSGADVLDVDSLISLLTPCIDQVSNTRSTSSLINALSVVVSRCEVGSALYPVVSKICLQPCSPNLAEVVCRSIAKFGILGLENRSQWEGVKGILIGKMMQKKRATSYPVGLLRVLYDEVVSSRLAETKDGFVTILRLIGCSMRSEDPNQPTESEEESDEDDEEAAHQVTLTAACGHVADLPALPFPTCSVFINSVKSSPHWPQFQTTIQQLTESNAVEFRPLLLAVGIL